ncbi:YxlC family protein [Paenibacillus pini]|uniref:Uncharacterized protein n=1 Tax=Paenibacillus pini JCM 16418 TaxID=1236976 RepID=W7YDK8_9BACL|nr:YxlC family protein [Paenibacillus pini]GAF06542.1 hypothetical protein JCM16418_501 [Paenibacillus pini JCM 16418]
MSKRTKKDDIIQQQDAEGESFLEQDELITEIVNSLDQMDQHLSVPSTPNLLVMQQLVMQHKQLLRQRNRKDLLIFIAVALIIVSIYAGVASVSFVWLILSQLLLFVIVGVYALIGYTHAQKKVKSPHA